MGGAVFEVCCPYCNTSFETGKPVRDAHSGARKQPEVACLPYTRDIGRFDPKTPRERTSPGGWSQVCNDFMTFLGFQRIGILRQVPGQPVDVMYRVQYCPGCKRLFDVYANYTPSLNLAQIWPHLFAVAPGRAGEIKRYAGISWPIWLADVLTRRLRLPKMEYGAMLLGLVIFLVGFLPWLFRGSMVQPAAGDQGVWMTLATYAAAAAGMTALLILMSRGVRQLQDSEDFYDLFRTSASHGVSYWYNYTLCRFVGVQTSGRLPQISQVEIWGSGLALISLVLVWIISHARQIHPLMMIGTAAAFGVIFWLLRQAFKKHLRRTGLAFFATLIILVLAVALAGPNP
jgi:hypothetical protein